MQSFSDAILPQDNYKMKTLAKLRDPYYLAPGEKMPFEAEWRLGRVLEQEIKNFRLVENAREVLLNSYDFDTIRCFNAIDVDQLGVFYAKNLDFFMRSCNLPLMDDEIRAFFRVVGSPEFERVSYSEFSQVLNPLRIEVPRSYAYQSPSRSYSQQKTSTLIYSSPRRRPQVNNSDYYEYLSKSIDKTLERSMKNRLYTPRDMAKSSYLAKSTQQFYPKSYQAEEVKQSSPIKVTEELHLVQALKSQISISREIDDLKKELAIRKDFNLFDAFKVFDKNSRGYLTKFETEQVLNSMQIYPTDEQMYLLFKKMDKDQDGFLTYAEFCSAILPQNQTYQEIINARLPQYINSEEGLDSFQFQTKYLFKKLIRKMIEGEIEAERVRQKLSKRPLFSINDAFTAIDNNDNGFITKQQFKEILNQYGVFVDQSDLQHLVERYDKDEDGKVSYKEFLQEMTPQSPYKHRDL
eukprot:TRINITY_DN4131_c0_g2_i1.p1 TRINITY_DN4131_c0_g2~~TRINITY_DN4131_c0_g2_i1.p1  ORF type:complete len:464 (+),score=64.82 TRINITY_DN4131_c0_g2_i1:336-1727(+)